MSNVNSPYQMKLRMISGDRQKLIDSTFLTQKVVTKVLANC